ncbi:hypothetical protein Tco_0299310 [Tanacetum coccineum]
MPDPFVCENMESVPAQVVAAAKLPMLNTNEFELWKMRIEQYFLMIDYALWEVIVNGDSPPNFFSMALHQRLGTFLVVGGYVFSESVINVPAVATSEVKTSESKPKFGNPQQELKDKGVIDSGCSRHMTGNRSNLQIMKILIEDLLPLEEVPKEGKLLKKGARKKKDVEDPENEDSMVPNTEEPRVNQEQDANVNNTNNINTISSIVNDVSIEDNAVDKNIVYRCDDDPNMPNLEEIVYSDDDEGVGAEADMTNLDTHILVNPISTTKIPKDHPLEHIIGDIHSTP